jgi:tripartite-type tricarboxylate transporter receptor subunit TctC
MLRLIAVFAFAAGLHGIGIADAQTYPTRTVRLILPYAPASGTDITARLFADRLGPRWGKPVVIENRPGGDGLVSLSAFVNANDDHALWIGPAGVFMVHPYEHQNLPYDAERDLLPVASLTTIILAMSTPASLKLASVKDFVALARAQPGKLNAAAANGNSDFLLFGFIKSSGLDVPKVPYRDILQAPNDLGENRIQVLMTSLAVVHPHMQSGRIKVLAVTSRQRAPSAPDVPTAIESGYPALELDSPVGIVGPRGMPLALRERIAEDFKAVAADDPLIAKRLEGTGQIVNVRGPAEYAATIAELRAKLAATAKVLGIKPAQ